MPTSDCFDALDALIGDHGTDKEATQSVVAEFHVGDYAVNIDTNGTPIIEAPEKSE